MFLALLLIITITIGGFGLTYLLDHEGTFLWRVAVGNVVGSAVFGLLCFFLSFFIGLNFVSILLPAVLVLLLITRLRFSDDKAIFNHDWDLAKGRIARFTFGRVQSLFYYLFFLVVFIAFFDRAIIETATGIYTGASNNLGDLPFHLGAIFGFSDGNNFPPQNPSFASTKFTYPFIADLLTAVMVKLGADLKMAMLFQNVTWAFALLVILERFTVSITKSRLAGKIAPFILFFSGGFGFVWFFRDYWEGSLGLFEMLWNLPRNYSSGGGFSWGNSMIVLFITQRSILLGMPITIFVLHQLWKFLAPDIPETAPKKRVKLSDARINNSAAYVGICAGTLPLIHSHSLLVLFVVSAFLFFFSLNNWKRWLYFAFGTSILALPPLAWMLIGSATNTSEFFSWHFGWDAGDTNVFWFWLKNTGLFIPLAVSGLVIATVLGPKSEDENDGGRQRSYKYLYFAAPFIFIFIVSNLAKFAPWEWDNIKLLIYWFVGLIPFASLAIAYLWQNGRLFQVFAGGFLAVLVAAGALDVWRQASAQMEYQVFDQGAVETSEAIRDRTKPDALFLNAPTYNTAVVLSGRRSLMRYIGHLSSHGIDFTERHEDLKKIYAGAASADILIKKYGIEYILISPLERKDLTVNDLYFSKKELFIESGEYRVYKVSSE